MKRKSQSRCRAKAEERPVQGATSHRRRSNPPRAQRRRTIRTRTRPARTRVAPGPRKRAKSGARTRAAREGAKSRVGGVEVGRRGQGRGRVVGTSRGGSRPGARARGAGRDLVPGTGGGRPRTRAGCAEASQS